MIRSVFRHLVHICCTFQWLLSIQAAFVAFCGICSSTVVFGALGLSSSSSIPYQCMCFSVISLCWVCCSTPWNHCP